MNKISIKSAKNVSKFPHRSTILHQQPQRRHKHTIFAKKQAKFATRKDQHSQMFSPKIFNPYAQFYSGDIDIPKRTIDDHAHCTRWDPQTDQSEHDFEQRQKRQSLQGKNRNESSSSIEYSSITKIAKFDNAASLETPPQDIVTGTHVDTLCSEVMKEASQYGVQYEDSSVCDVTSISYTSTSTDQHNKRAFHTTSSSSPFFTQTNIPLSKNLHIGTSPNLHIGTSPNPPIGTSFRSSIGKRNEKEPNVNPFDDPVFYASYNIIGDTRTGWKSENEISQDFFLKDPTLFEQAKTRVSKSKIPISASIVANTTDHGNGNENFNVNRNIDNRNDNNDNFKKFGFETQHNHPSHSANTIHYASLDPLLSEISKDMINIGSSIHASSLATAAKATPLTAEISSKSNADSLPTLPTNSPAGIATTTSPDQALPPATGPLTTQRRTFISPKISRIIDNHIQLILTSQPSPITTNDKF